MEELFNEGNGSVIKSLTERITATTVKKPENSDPTFVHLAIAIERAKVELKKQIL